MAETGDDSGLVEGQQAWSLLVRELDRPLMPGFMTAGYAALGRYIYLTRHDRDESREAVALKPVPTGACNSFRTDRRLELVLIA